MAVTISRNLAGVRPGDPAAFIVGANICSYFTLGKPAGNDFWLDARIVGPPPEFIFNGRIFVPGISPAGTVIDNFPKGPTPTGWTKRHLMDREGYELVDGAGKILFGYEVLDLPDLAGMKICHVTVNLHAADGSLIAEALPDQFLIHRGRADVGGISADIT